MMFVVKIYRKYRTKYSENKQKIKKSEFFFEKKSLKGLFGA